MSEKRHQEQETTEKGEMQLEIQEKVPKKLAKTGYELVKRTTKDQSVFNEGDFHKTEGLA